MATHTWTGAAADNDYSTAGNWTGGVPIAAGDVVIGNNAAGASVAITAGLNQSAVAIASFSVNASYDATIGSTDGSAYLQLNTTGNIIYWGAGVACIDASVAAYALLEVNPTDTAGELYWKSGTAAAIGTAADLKAGIIRWVSGDVTALYVNYTSSTIGGPTVYWMAGTGGSTDLGEITGGTIEQTGGTIVASISGGIVTVYDGTCGLGLITGGSVDYRSTTTVSGLAISNEAEITFANDVRPKTVSSAIAYGRAEVDARNPNVTWTAGIVTVGQPTVLYPTRRALATA